MMDRGVAEAVIVGAVRTPIGKYGGALSTIRPDDLGALVLESLMERTGVPPEEVEDVYIGCGNQAGEDNRDIARMSLLLAGFPVEVAGTTVNRLCGSGLEAVANAARAIMLGEAHVYVGGGVESMSRAPWAMPKPERAFKESGSVTAGNSSSLNDGAAAVLVVSAEYARAHGLTPMARIKSMGVAGVPPRVMGVGPVPSTKKVLERAGLSLDDIGLIEENEAFAAQTLAVLHEWGMDPNDERLNPNGGAIALGHPIGCSGVRILTTLLHEMGRREEVELGLATMCIGVGQGIAMVVEKAA
jgi:acetyl-CoA acetyltransferase